MLIDGDPDYFRNEKYNKLRHASIRSMHVYVAAILVVDNKPQHRQRELP